MMRNDLTDDAMPLWKDLVSSPTQIDFSQIPAESLALRENILRRNRAGALMGWSLGGILLGGLFWFRQPLLQLGCGVSLAGVAVMLVQMKNTPPDQAHGANSIATSDFYREVLRRERDYHSGWRMWLRWLTFVPGLMLICAGAAFADTRLAVWAWFLVATFLVLTAVGVPFTLRLARKFQDRLEAVDAMVEDLGHAR